MLQAPQHVCLPSLQMHHPNLVQFLGACTRSKPYMLVLEYLPGGR